LDSETPGFFKLEDATRLQVFADQAAVAIQNARAFEQASELAAAEERQRLARDLHDAVSQTLFSASVIAETLPRLFEHNLDEVRDGLAQLVRLTKGALAEMRTLLIELRPSDMVEIELWQLLQHLVNGFQSRTDAKITFRISGDDYNIPVDAKIALYRIAQESLNNVTKHARATQVELLLMWQPDRVELEIHDDGRGFSTADIPANHMGIRIMNERAAAVGLTLSVSSTPGQGTIIQAEWQQRQTDDY
jgi:signal transduction histidine kinase